jgi:NADP-dependent 3-hydroxy acid dehydrogenase YdfG
MCWQEQRGLALPGRCRRVQDRRKLMFDTNAWHLFSLAPVPADEAPAAAAIINIASIAGKFTGIENMAGYCASSSARFRSRCLKKCAQSMARATCVNPGLTQTNFDDIPRHAQRLDDESPSDIAGFIIYSFRTPLYFHGWK